MSPRKSLLRISAVFMLAVTEVFLASAAVVAQNAQPLVDENALKQVSDHVYVIMGYPNIGIIVGNRATLVVDTGLGARNGATVVRVARRLAKGPMLYLTTTHFHPEHTSGAQAFPANTILIRPAVQQEEMDKQGAPWIERFRNMSALNRALLRNVQIRPADVLFDNEVRLNLGGVNVRLFWLGPAHTNGDELVYVAEDSALLPGDIVQNKLIPNIIGEQASAKSWIVILDKLEPLKPRLIVPDHGALGDDSLIAQERAFLVDLRGRALELKRQGKSADEAAELVETEFKAKYPDWTGSAISSDVRRVYTEPQ